MPNPLEYIVSRALIYCTEGTAIDQFRSSGNSCYKIGELVGVENDLELGINLPKDFGYCKAKGKENEKCVPDISKKWQDTYGPLKGEHKNTLVFRCTLKCTKGGTIKFSTSGQKGGGELDKSVTTNTSEFINPGIVQTYPRYTEKNGLEGYHERNELELSIINERSSVALANGAYQARETINNTTAIFFRRGEEGLSKNIKSGIEYLEDSTFISNLITVSKEFSKGNITNGIIDSSAFIPGGIFVKKYEGLSKIENISADAINNFFGYELTDIVKYKFNDINAYNYKEINDNVQKLIDEEKLPADSLGDKAKYFQRNDYGSKEACTTMAEFFGAQSDAMEGKKVLACFPAGTLISTEKGYKVIEDIKPRDLVWAKNELNNEVSLKKVLKTFIRETDVLIKLILEDEKIKTTEEHPFYTKEGWKEANELSTEDYILAQDNQWYRIKNKQFLYSREKVYNFEVEKFHTYFVGKEKILVHNACEKQVEGPLPPK